MSTSKLIELNIEILRPSHIADQNRLKKLKDEKEKEKKSKDDESDRISRIHLHPNLDLEQGKNLPEYLQGDVEDHYKCKPLVDIDPYYEDKQTYVILDENFAIYRFSTTNSLFLLSPVNCVRKTANRIFVHSFFNSVIMFTILVNCGFMTMNTDGKPWIEDYVENVFLGIYTFESIVKVLSRGFIFPHFTYLRDPWNILDISVIFTAYLDLVMQQTGGGEGGTIPGMAALRAFRVLRALKAISAIPGLKAIVSALIESVKALKDVMILTLFCLSVFALIGLQLFMGSLRNKCVLEWPPNVRKDAEEMWKTQNFTHPIFIPNSVLLDNSSEFKKSQFAFQNHNESLGLLPYTTYVEKENAGLLTKSDGSLISLPMFCDRNPREDCSNGSVWTNQSWDEWIEDDCNYCFRHDYPWLCGNGSGAGGCERGFSCTRAGENPNFGYTSFDTFPAALLSLFRLLAQDYWEDLYMKTLRANGQIYLLFFMLVIFLGSFYLINLILAVVAMAYDEQHQIVAAEEERKKRLMQEKKLQLEAFIEDITIREDRLQSGKMSHATDAGGGGGTGYESGRSSPREPSIASSKRFSEGDQRRNTLVRSHENTTKPTIEFGLNDQMRPSYGSDTIDVEAGVLARINEALIKPNNFPSGILRNSPAGSIRGSDRNLGLITSDERKKKRHYTEGSENEGKGSLTSLLGGRNIDGENLEFNGICDLNHEQPPHSDLRISNREDHIHHSNKTLIVDQNGIVSVVPASDGVRQRGSSPIDMQPRHRTSTADFDRLPIDYLRPNPPMQHSRLSLTIEHMTEPQLAKMKQRAMSQATVMSEGIEHDPTQSCWYRFFHKSCVWECNPYWIKLQAAMKILCDDCFFDMFITLCIVANTLFLGMEHQPMSEYFKLLLENANFVFSMIFLGEFVIKMIGMHPFYYFQEAWNCFDFVIVTVSMLEMGLEGVEGLSVLRSFRLMRVFKLAKSWPTLNMLIKIIGNSMGSLGNLTLILLILLFIFAVVGKQLFREDYRQWRLTDPELRWHMDDFFHSFLIVFRILCGEWIETMWDCMRIVNKNSGPNLKAVCVPVFLLVQIVGNLVVLNLFLALLLSSFTGNLEPDADGELNSIQMSMMRIRKFRSFILQFLIDKRTAIMKCRRRQLAHNGSSKGDRSDINSSSSSPISATGHGESPVTNVSGEIIAQRPNQNQRDNSNSDHIIPHPNTLHCDSKGGIELVGTLPNCVDDFIQVPKATAESDFGKDDSDTESANISLHGHESSIYGTESTVSTSSSMSNSEYERQQAIDLQLQKTQETENLNEPQACWPVGCIAKFKFLDPPIESDMMKMWWNARKISYRIVEHAWFETFIILMILLSSAALAFEDVYYPHKPTLKKVLKYADRIFTYIFIFEMLLKWLGYGMKKYFTNAWCGLDFMIVAVSIVGLVTEALGLNDIPGIRSLRTLRAMRPLRALSRFQGMKVVVNALIGAIPSIFNVLMVCLIFWLIFSIMGVNLFAGKFYKCLNVTDGIKLLHENVTLHVKQGNNETEPFYFPVINRTICLEIQNLTNNEIMWVNSKITFDNAFSGYLALMQIATFKGWMPIMYDAVDMTDQDLQPIFEYSKGYYVYFIAFIVFGSFCTLNLFIGVIIDNFNQQKKKLGGQDIFMTEEQRKYYNAMKKLGSKKPQKPVPRPKNKCQAWVFDIVTHQIFEITIMLLIIANMVTMMIEHHNMDPKLDEVLVFINYVFVAIFCGEASIKLFALRHHYFTNPWNVFDFIVVVFSIVGSALNDLINKYLVQPTLFRIIRLARIGRILRLIKGAKGIRTLLFALMMSLPALVNIGLLLILVMFIYSIFGMSQFSYVKRMTGVDDMYNFETFTNSFICLFMITTSAGWAELLQPLLSSEHPDCDRSLKNGNPAGNGDCGSPAMGIAFFVTYLIFTFLIVVNMYIAIILENFGVATEESTDPLGEEDFEMFYEVWERFDPKATQFIAYAQLSDMVDSLHSPLRVPKPNNRQLVAMDLPMVIGDRLHCLDILFALTKRVLGESEELEGLRSQMEEKFMASNPSKVSYEPITTTLWRKQEELSAVRIQRWWRSFRFRRTIYAASNLALKQSQSSPPQTNDDFQEANGLPMNGHEMQQPPLPHRSDEAPPEYTFHADSVDFHVDLNAVLAEEQSAEKKEKAADGGGGNNGRPQSNGSATVTTDNSAADASSADAARLPSAGDKKL